MMSRTKVGGGDKVAIMIMVITVTTETTVITEVISGFSNLLYTIKDKNYWVVRNAEFAGSGNTWNIKSNFFKINELITF